MKKTILAILSAALLSLTGSPAANAYDQDFFGKPSELDQELEAAARWAGFYGPVRSSVQDDPRSMDGYFTDQVCIFGIFCMQAPEPYIVVTIPKGYPKHAAYVILFHEIAHYWQYAHGVLSDYASVESDADLLGAKFLVAYGQPLEAYLYVWVEEAKCCGGDAEPGDGLHPKISVRIWNVLSQVPARAWGERSEAP